MTKMMNTFISHRQMGEAEAVYKLFPDFHFRDSNITCEFVSTSRRAQRSKFLIRADGNPAYANQLKFKIPNREGEFVEKYDIVSKYERRPRGVLDNICLAQFVKMYKTSSKGKKGNDNEVEPTFNENEEFSEEFLEDEEKFHYIMSSNSAQKIPLPEILELDNPNPGEPRFMQKRSFQQFLEFINSTKRKNQVLIGSLN